MSEKLSKAIKLHQQGRLAQAAEIYQEILAANPQHADALHLLGVLLYQQGNHSRAVSLIGQAIALNPNAANYHANLAEAYRAQGKLVRAVACCRTALRIAPDYAEAANNLGLALMDQGNLGEAIDQFRAAIRNQPNLAMAHNNLGNALRAAGDKEAAIRQFRHAVELAPNMAEALSNLGQMLLEQDESSEALVHCLKARELRPNLPEARNNLGNVLRELDRLAEAKAEYAEALRLNPDLAMTYNNLGQALQEEGHLDEAVNWYHQALAREPTSARIHCNLASALGVQEKHDEAIARYQIALQFDPDFAEAHNGLGYVYHDQDRYQEAKQCYREAIRLKPDFAAAHCNLGRVHEELSEFEQAQACFHESLRYNPKHGGSHAQLAIMARDKLPEEDVQTMLALLADPDRPRKRCIGLHFGLAQVYDARRDYAKAAEHLQQANTLRKQELEKQGKRYEPGDHTQFVDNLIRHFTPEFFEGMRGLGLQTDRPIFVVGLPRSATTLTEQILASHSAVFGAGELRLARQSFEALPEATGSQSDPFGCLGQLNRDALQHLAQQHLDRLTEIEPVSPRIADKMPDNYLYLGLLAVMFPNARFIHTRRDLRDVAVSCWITNFRQIRWACDFDHIASRFHQYERIMEHWRRVLPVPMMEVDYADTVGDFENVARRLLDWCGLPWEPQCLAFHESKRPIRTASVAQVRQPIYTRSLERWRNYEQQLEALFGKLG